MVTVPINTLMGTILFISTSILSLSHGVILRPDWYPYFQDEKQELGQVFDAREIRTPASNIECPPDMTKFECYHELMAVWTRVLKKNRRRELQEAGFKLDPKLNTEMSHLQLLSEFPELASASKVNSKFPFKLSDVDSGSDTDKTSIFDL